ncbi:MAG: flavin reductase family protein [Saprospiraceae bacterium]
MLKIDPAQTPTKDFHQFMLGAVAPRPIAFVSSVSPDGVSNLAPYSFFNAFSSNPPIVVFSSNRRVENNTTKDTLRNAREVGELVINVVSHAIARQMALTSIEYGPEVDEFEMAGFSKLPSERVRPFRVAESPVQMECVVDQIIPLGESAGAGHLIVCRILLMHIDERVLTPNGRIDPHKIDLVGRMGRFWYARASGAAVEEIVQPVNVIGIGFPGLPESIRVSPVLSGADLAELAALPALPDAASAAALAAEDPEAARALAEGQEALHRYIKKAIEGRDIDRAAKAVALAGLSAR